ncbi:ECF-type sigma factor [Novosphingobium nitrogenifigens DSM 19370]|uniref:ECF-type sigma factor n=1 Tax=Novosphingobium nitrogenifigens DSM 19370 TaxID=983920 RepID=F1ZAJ8_9SPHN|nr:sigma-70 region 4 domain-containing protein [Novosphingobium nitrogenifigens]EGD58365.1 ECF-type sigma factor [Novosphingobium nitrogenifigens DSM 19370]
MCALHRMTPRQRAIFWAVRLDGTSYDDLALRHGIGIGDVEAEFAAALRQLCRAVQGSWWKRLRLW